MLQPDDLQLVTLKRSLLQRTQLFHASVLSLWQAAALDREGIRTRAGRPRRREQVRRVFPASVRDRLA